MTIEDQSRWLKFKLISDDDDCTDSCNKENKSNIIYNYIKHNYNNDDNTDYFHDNNDWNS